MVLYLQPWALPDATIAKDLDTLDLSVKPVPSPKGVILTLPKLDEGYGRTQAKDYQLTGSGLLGVV